MRRPTPTYAIRLSPPEKADLEARAAAHGLTVSDVLRRGGALLLDALDEGKRYAGAERRGGRRVRKTTKPAQERVSAS